MQQIIGDFGTWQILSFRIPLRIYGYGLMLVLGFLLGIFLAQWRARRGGENPEQMAHVGLLSLIGGIVGSRAAYVIENYDRQFAGAEDMLLAVLNVTSGGLIYYGGLVLATVMVLGYLLARRLPIRRYLDMVAVSLMIGLAFGRAGCLLNGCCYGRQCDENWALSTRFPIYSKPLIKFDGRENPYSADTVGPSPVYAHQLEKPRIAPPDVPDVLVNTRRSGRVLVDGRPADRTYVLEPRYLHGALTGDQTAVWADPNGAEAARKAFYDLAGADRVLNEKEWAAGLKRDGGLLRGSEHWDEARVSDFDGSGKLTFEEAYDYLASRRKRFDADGDGKLSRAERARANAFLRADQLEAADHTHSLAVKPAQLLGLFNALVLAGLLWFFYRLRRREGQVFALLVVLYPITRFVLEAIRDDNAHNLLKGVFTHNQYTSMVLTTIGIVMWLLLRWLPASTGPTWAGRAAAAATVRAKPRKR